MIQVFGVRIGLVEMGDDVDRIINANTQSNAGNEHGCHIQGDAGQPHQPKKNENRGNDRQCGINTTFKGSKNQTHDQNNKDNGDADASDLAVDKALGANMTRDTIERAIKRGTGEGDDTVYEEIRYEGYGPGGVAIMADCLTDNKNRTTPEIKTILNKNGGSLGASGCVSYLFDRKGMLIIGSGQTSEDDLMEELMEFDIEDIKTEDDGSIVITSSPEGYNEIYDYIEGKNFTMNYNEITFIPQTTTTLDESKAAKCLKLIELIEEQDDVQNVYSNYDISEEIMMKISEEE